ncbi:hypothetical protein [Anaeromyxobacter diazotrophicus]|uniref:Uncharacterized protein n=1 Tax=Anaeromyxobacter diazotrophicus TaxID=2590199 RepID=A0A7I9VRH6_9BACT|nr:hypothetical protein [Anaeromyxobacter diazotrophicus]GEJ58961.1 hypothetical protein AMYX_37020 [Anaeromyxobacter diazotrophicus]
MARPTVILLLALGCGSTAPYTAASAAINTGLAAGLSAASRAGGGCYSPCNPGYTCNPATGFCEQLSPVCVGEAADPRCAPSVPIPIGTKQPGTPRDGSAPPVGISPATGRAPPAPGERPAP